MYQLINLLTATINKHFCERRIKNDQATFLYFFNAPVPNNYHVITSRSLSDSDKNEVWLFALVDCYISWMNTECWSRANRQ